MMRRFFSAACSVLIVSAGAVALQTGTAEAVQAPHNRVVSPVSASFTPHVGNRPAGVAGNFRVYAFAQVGQWMVAGGLFDSVSQTKGGTPITRYNVFAFNATTGAINTGFAPVVDGEVSALWPGPDGASVFIGGKFNYVNGVVSRKLARLNLSNGQAVSGFTVPYINGPVNDFATLNGRLFVGGQFSTVKGIAHSGLATINPATGALDPYMSVQLTEHHNWNGTGAYALVGAYKFDITADGTRMVAVGNFKHANGGDHDQVVVIDLGSTSATLANWQTNHFKNPCAPSAFDAWVRDVGFSPDGTYFAIASTGAPAGDLCDSTSRWENTSGADLHPTWVDYTGGDSLWSIAVTGAAIYIGGHQRWTNNSFAGDSAGPGAVGRAGIAALDPVNGLPLTWNAGRNPRGAGAFAFLATPAGLWVGSDTNYIGNFQFYRGKLAFFPLAGGKVTPPTTTGRLPGTVYQAGKIACTGCGGNDSVVARSYDGGAAVGGDVTTVTEAGFWSNVRGAVLINGELWLGSTNGYFYKRSFDGTTFGPVVYTDPYNDPYWSNVSTGRGTTYRGLIPAFYVNEIPYIASMFYTNGRLYYTFVGQPGMYYRYFTPESGVIGTDRFQVADGLDWSDAGGNFLAGNNLYVSVRSNGHLYRFAWDGTKAVAAGAAVVSGPTVDGRDWRANAMWVR